MSDPRYTPAWETTIAGYPIELAVTGKGTWRETYRVTYGWQADEGLRYEQAATKLGEALMHALNIEGKL